MALAVACNSSDLQAYCICWPNLVWFCLSRNKGLPIVCCLLDLSNLWQVLNTLMATLTAPVSDFAARLIFLYLAALNFDIFRILILVLRRKLK